MLIDQQHRTLEQGDSTVLMHRAQGAIAVLRNIQNLRDAINGESSTKKNKKSRKTEERK